MPRYYYKFMPLNQYTYENLAKGQIWFSSPLDFNDPYDFMVPYDINFYDRYFSKLIQQDKSISDKDIIQYNIYFKQNPDKLKEVVEKSNKLLAEKVKIACFCEEKTEILMWSHYANFHKGICLKFDSSLDDSFFS